MNTWLSRYACFLSGLTAVLILAGGLVTSNEAGLAVPDWPLSYGQWMPPMVGNIFWEHGHRMIAATVGFLTIILAVWTQIVESRKWLKVMAWIALLAVIIQGLLGGLTVIYLLPAPISISHACLAQSFFSLLLVITYFLGEPAWDNKPSKFVIQPVKDILVFATLFTFIQLVLGATLRHTGWGVMPHILNAFFVLFLIFRVHSTVLQRQLNDGMLEKGVPVIALMAVMQFALGIGAFVTTQLIQNTYAPERMEVIFTAAHQTLGALILGSLVLMTVRSFR